MINKTKTPSEKLIEINNELQNLEVKHSELMKIVEPIQLSEFEKLGELFDMFTDEKITNPEDIYCSSSLSNEQINNYYQSVTNKEIELGLLPVGTECGVCPLLQIASKISDTKQDLVKRAITDFQIDVDFNLLIGQLYNYRKMVELVRNLVNSFKK